MPGGDYDALLERGRTIYAPTRVGRPGHGWAYWPLYVLSQVLRLRWAICVAGADEVATGPAILIGNHLALTDPLMAGMSLRRRVTFFTKVEAFEGSAGLLFRSIGQIPLRRGDEESTQWALDISSAVLAQGGALGVYPEGTRSPDGVSLHRLHRRVLVPILQANEGVPVHVMAVSYRGRRRGRIHVDLRFSPPLPLDVHRMTPDELTDAVRDALLATGGMPYTHAFGRSIKTRPAE